MNKLKALQSVSAKSVAETNGNVRAILTAPVVDSHGDVFDTKTMVLPLKGGEKAVASNMDGTEAVNIPIVTNHDLETGGINTDVRDTIGHVVSAKLNDKDELEAELFFSSIDEAQKMKTLILEGCLDDCLSLVYWHYGESEDGVIRNSEPFQLGVVWKGSNHRARVIAKSHALNEEEPKATDTLAEAPAELSKEESNNPKEEEVTKTTEVAAKAAAEAPNQVVSQHTETVDTIERQREIATKAMAALNIGDSAEYRRLNAEMGKLVDNDVKRLAAKAAAAEGRLGYASIEQDFVQAFLDAEGAKVQQPRGILSRITTKTLTGNSAEYRKRVRTQEFVYKPAPYGKKKVVQNVKPTWLNVKVQPWAVIASWDEEIAEDAPFDYYAEVISDLNEGADDNRIFNMFAFAGGDFGGRTYAATGILPILKTAGGRYVKYAADSTFAKALATAYGKIVTTSKNPQIGLAMTRATRASLAGVQDSQGRLLFTGSQSSVNLGLLGEVYIEEVPASVVPDGTIVMGDFSQYVQVEKGGLKLLASQHATLGDVSLYQTDGEAMRARQRIAGGPLLKEAFVVLGTANDTDGGKAAITLPAQPSTAGY